MRQAASRLNSDAKLCDSAAIGIARRHQRKLSNCCAIGKPELSAIVPCSIVEGQTQRSPSMLKRNAQIRVTPEEEYTLHNHVESSSSTTRRRLLSEAAAATSALVAPPQAAHALKTVRLCRPLDVPNALLARLAPDTPLLMCLRLCDFQRCSCLRWCDGDRRSTL